VSGVRNDGNIRDRRDAIPFNHLSDGSKASGQESGEESGSEEADHGATKVSVTIRSWRVNIFCFSLS
jgi:hypothetical protein